MQQIVNWRQRRGKLVGIVRRRIFQLLEQVVVGGANFRRIRRIGLLAVGDMRVSISMLIVDFLAPDAIQAR